MESNICIAQKLHFFRIAVGVALLVTASMSLGILLYRALRGLDSAFEEEYEGCDFIG